MELKLKIVHYNGKFEDGSKSVTAHEVDFAFIDSHSGIVGWEYGTVSQQEKLISYNENFDYYNVIYEVSLNGEVIFQNFDYLRGLTDDEIKFAKTDRFAEINWNELFDTGNMGF